ncbi:hypothetical protein BD626DRAFT_554623 [Schizophyllum amplum]|uniref:Uncharacterized protein n=1 Tax=Schizophyllum amplum TaxID=97359 RepID=A0A550CRP4_9AGAR|nr:hypothetical protein BD626DRAFT_554623 [Auriculariopsis ampla]
MSAEQDKAQASTGSLRFPPFPRPPSGVSITPFAEFKERGIKKHCGLNNPEIDTEGIRTVAIRIADYDRDRDYCKTRSIFQQETPHIKRTFTRPPAMSKEWWNEWKVEEPKRRVYRSYDVSIDPSNRLTDASREFSESRRHVWPPMHNKTSIRDMWVQFCLFSGLQFEHPIWQRTDRPAPPDDDDDSDPENQSPQAADQPKKRVIMHMPYAVWGEPQKVDSDEAVRALYDAASDRRVKTLASFVTDPAHGTAVFLSSHMIDQAFIFYNHLLDGTPRLLRFFYDFILRNNVFREPKLRSGFERAIEVADRAFVELPATAALARALPDKFSVGCTKAFPQPTADPVDAINVLLKGGAVLAEDISADEWGPTDGWDGPSTAQWDSQETDYLAEILGDEAACDLQLSYTRGTTERSMRRIADVKPPVASAFAGRLARVELAPWPDYHPFDPADNIGERIYSRPEVDGNAACATKDIVLLVEPAVADRLIVGMGIGGTWVQLVPTDSTQGADYWYVEAMKKSIPSYYTC